MPTLLAHRHQAGVHQLRQLRAGRLRGDARHGGQLAGAAVLATQQRGQHARAGGVGDDGRNAREVGQCRIGTGQVHVVQAPKVG